MDIERIFTQNNIGLLEEAFNIAAGNAITALSQILLCDTDMSLPVLKGVLTPFSSEVFDRIECNSTLVEMNIVGELQGELAIVIPDSDERKLVSLIREARDEQRADGVPDSSIIVETGNILAGTFLTAIHDFCGLNLYHTVPLYKNAYSNNSFEKMQHSINASRNVMLMVTTEFMVNKANIRAYMLVVLTIDQVNRFIQAIEKIRPV
jgi:chemotaxis protein CheC